MVAGATRRDEKREIKEDNGPVRKWLRYRKNRPRPFKYKEALAAGLPFGFGEVESGNRSSTKKTKNTRSLVETRDG